MNTPLKSPVQNSNDTSPKAGDTAPSLAKRPTRGRTSAVQSDNSQTSTPSSSQGKRLFVNKSQFKG